MTRKKGKGKERSRGRRERSVSADYVQYYEAVREIKKKQAYRRTKGMKEEKEMQSTYVRTTTGAFCARDLGIARFTNLLVDWLDSFVDLPAVSYWLLLIRVSLFSTFTLFGEDISFSTSRFRSWPIRQYSFQTLKKSFGSWPLSKSRKSKKK